MKKYYVSHDFLDTKPISLEELLNMAYDSKTNPAYADYLQMVLKTSKRMTGKRGLESVDFGVHLNGAIIPFGEGGHEYCKNFYKSLEEVIDELPPLPLSMFVSDN